MRSFDVLYFLSVLGFATWIHFLQAHFVIFLAGGLKAYDQILAAEAIVLTGHVLQRLDLSYVTHHRPLVRGDNITR